MLLWERVRGLLRQELERRQKKYDWQAMARPEQRIPEGPWRIWLIVAGRGFGKTRTGAETVRQWATRSGYKRICLLGNHLEEVRKIMIEGESGILSLSPPHEAPRYEPSKHQLIWPSGAIAWAHSANSPSSLRGPQFDAAWIDELAKFSRPQEAWDQLMLCLRLGSLPRVVITTTPRPIPLLRTLLQRSDVVVTRGCTLDNRDHLSSSYLEEIQKTYGGTRLGEQEIQGKMVETPTGLWQQVLFQRCPTPPPMERIVVAIDPAVTHKETSDETGIIVAGRDREGLGYILQDLSGRFSPTQWMSRAVAAYESYQADRLIAETNNGGDMVQQLLHTLFPHVPYRGVVATRSKIVRAEPIAALYEQQRIFHCGAFPILEEQMMYPAAASPDRLDALVWALTDLFLGGGPPTITQL